MLDIDLVRQQCAACNKLIHFNNAGAALSPDSVTEAVIHHIRLEQELGGYEAAGLAESRVSNFYQAMARLLHCQSDEIAYVENATRAWDLALSSIPLTAGDEIITFGSEYASNYMGLLHLARQKQLQLTLAPLNEEGLVDLEQLEKMISKRSRVLALTHIASQRGDIQPAAEVGEIARKHGLFYLLDACQSAGQMELDVGQLQCDFLCGTGRKFLRGPRGTGFLYVNADKLNELEPVFVDLEAAQWLSRESFAWRNDARRFENFERFVAGMIGLGLATDIAISVGLDAIAARIAQLRQYLEQALQGLDGIRVLERSSNRSGIVSLSNEHEAAPALKQRLQKAGINTSVASAINARLDLEPEAHQAVLRASLHYYNTEAEIDRFVEELQRSETG